MKHALSLSRCESFPSALYKVFPNYSILLFPNCENGVTNELNYLVNANERVQLRSHFSKNERKTTTGTFCILYLLLFFPSCQKLFRSDRRKSNGYSVSILSRLQASSRAGLKNWHRTPFLRLTDVITGQILDDNSIVVCTDLKKERRLRRACKPRFF